MDVKTFQYMKLKVQLTNNERGMALVTALLLMTVLAVLITVSTQWAASDVFRTAKYTKSRAAFYIAQAGIQTALHELNYTSGVAPGAASNGFDDELDGSTSNWGPYADISYGGGTFTVVMVDNDPITPNSLDNDETVILTSTGEKGGVEVEIKALIHLGTYEGIHALLTEGDLTASGNISVLGTSGSIHSNEDLILNGISDGQIAGDATGYITCTGAECVGKGIDEPIPEVTISDYKPYANYVLNSNGTITDKSVNLTYAYTNPGGGNWTNTNTGDGNSKFGDIKLGTAGGDAVWKFNSTGNSTEMADGMYYVEGNASVSSTPDGWETTIIAEGYIDISAGGNFGNYDGPGPLTNSLDIQTLLFIAGTDIEFSGSPNQSITGLIYAKEQLSVSGTVMLNGYAIAANEADVENLVSPASTISGNMTITFNSDLPNSLQSDRVVILSWQES
jgi:hypothetical protein